MKKNSEQSKQRLFEVMGRLDKTFTKPKLNEGFEEIEATDDVALPMETGEESPMEEPKEQSPEEKLAALTAKIDSLYAMIHGDESGEESAEAEEEKLEGEPVENDPENLQEWNFDKKKGEKEEKPKGKTQFNFDKKKDDSEEEEEDLDEVKEPTKKVPVAAIAKVGK